MTIINAFNEAIKDKVKPELITILSIKTIDGTTEIEFNFNATYNPNRKYKDNEELEPFDIVLRSTETLITNSITYRRTYMKQVSEIQKSTVVGYKAMATVKAGIQDYTLPEEWVPEPKPPVFTEHPGPMLPALKKKKGGK